MAQMSIGKIVGCSLGSCFASGHASVSVRKAGVLQENARQCGDRSRQVHFLRHLPEEMPHAGDRRDQADKGLADQPPALHRVQCMRQGLPEEMSIMENMYSPAVVVKGADDKFHQEDKPKAEVPSNNYRP